MVLAGQNWRPLFFAKFFSVVANATTVEEALGRLLAPNVFLEWTSHYWPSSPRQPADAGTYEIKWSSSTAPPVVSPLEFIAYGYGSCSAWATFVTYVARSVGLPARQAGTPCWNSEYSGVDFRGLSHSNKNVSLCWHGGSSERGHGGGFLNNHNWAEVYLPAASGASGASASAPSSSGGRSAATAGYSGAGWTFVNVPPASKEPDAGLCGADFNEANGCGFDRTKPSGSECEGVHGGPGAAMQDHEIFAVTWSKPGEDAAAEGAGSMGAIDEGGPVIDPAGRSLTDGHTPLTPLVWAPKLASPLGAPLRNVGLRLVNRTAFYRCKPGKKPA